MTLTVPRRPDGDLIRVIGNPDAVVHIQVRGLPPLTRGRPPRFVVRYVRADGYLIERQNDTVCDNADAAIDAAIDEHLALPLRYRNPNYGNVA